MDNGRTAGTLPEHARYRRYSGKKILDFGCGKGDFYQFLKENDVPVEYTGCDINGSSLMLHKRNTLASISGFSTSTRMFLVKISISSSSVVFSISGRETRRVIKDTLITLFARCRIGLAFNALSAHNPNKDFELHYTSPEELSPFQ